MSSTRFHDDPCRIKKQLQEQTGTLRYMLNKPGWGANPCFMNDSYLRMQEWGANLRTDSINLESDLLGLTRTINNRDLLNKDNYQNMKVESNPIKYPVCNPITDQSRVTHPAWWYKDLEQSNWNYLFENPQKHTSIPFENNLSSRILEKDAFDEKNKNCK
jgi:hypothetical protein